MVIHWINLTNGLQAIHDHNLSTYSVMRLQSTHCEQKRWEDVLASVPDEFLFRLALGDECRVYDYGARKIVPRAVWQGLAWVSYATRRRWLGEVLPLEGRVRFASPYFDHQYRQLSKKATARLDYFRPLVTGRPQITFIVAATSHDGDKAWLFQHINRRPHEDDRSSMHLQVRLPGRNLR